MMISTFVCRMARWFSRIREYRRHGGGNLIGSREQ